MMILDGVTGSWPRRMDTGTSARYLEEEHGLPIEPKTLTNLRAARKGPAVRYFGAKPLYDRVELDRWAEQEALQPISPLTRNARRRAERQVVTTKAGTAATADAGHSAPMRQCTSVGDCEPRAGPGDARAAGPIQSRISARST
jgi:hypothetical protein